MATILYLTMSRATTCAQLKLSGAHQRLVRDGHSVRQVSLANCRPADLRDLVEFWNARGLIVDCGGHRPAVNAKRLPDIPVVYLDIAREFAASSIFSVSYDIRATCHLAARELLSLNCATYAYAGYGKGVPWSEERKRVFTQALRLNGHVAKTFELNPATNNPSAFYRELTAWLQRIDKPAGILAADDAYAVHLHSVAQNLKLRIPADVAILGVDNDASLLATPGISSIQLDFLEAGKLSADLLLTRMANPALKPTSRHFGPVQLLRRSSTRKLHGPEGSFQAILQQIREQAPHGLSAAQAAALFPGSRRSAEIRFREATGHSILAEITVARIDRAKELLANVDFPIGEIAELCGYRTFNAFRDAFRSQTGSTPRDWRKRRQAQSLA